MSFGAREPAWRRREADRARQQRQDHEARRRHALGLAPIQPRRVENPGFAMDFGTSTITAAASSAFLNYGNTINSFQNMYRHYELGINSRRTLSESIDIPDAPQDVSEAKKMCADPEPAEREPTLLEAWRD